MSHGRLNHYSKLTCTTRACRARSRGNLEGLTPPPTGVDAVQMNIKDGVLRFITCFFNMYLLFSVKIAKTVKGKLQYRHISAFLVSSQLAKIMDTQIILHCVMRHA